MQNTAEEALSDMFRVGFDGAITGFMNASFSFIDNVLTDMAAMESLNGMCERNLER